MIILRDSIVIGAPPERVWAWLEHLPENYRAWHPDHVGCHFDQGTSLKVGTVLHIEERLHGRVHRLRLRATGVVPARALHYRSRGFRGAFLLEPSNGATRFTAELSFGIQAPVIGAALDVVLRRLLKRRLEALRSHMREEGGSLKRLLERGSSARPDP